ncbi:MAG: alanine racemase [Oscillospiraceae bacterium]|nr:alanine racemase [Oscillospiraceae bacterium]
MHTTDRTWAEIRLDHLTHNYNELRSRIPSDCRFLAPVKANAYGHGAVVISRHLETLGADYLAVACIAEALELREAGIKLPILNLGPAGPEDAEILVQNYITQTVFSLEMAERLSHALNGTNQALSVHIELDTGLGRLGFPVNTKANLEDLRTTMALPHLDVEGIFTHFAVADSDEYTAEYYNDDYTEEQLEHFTLTTHWLEAETGKQFPLRHAANSGGALRFPRSHLNMVRPGISLYGISPNEALIAADLRPLMSLKTRILQIKPLADGGSISYGRTYQAKGEQTIAVVPAGYADGLHRALSNNMDMLINGQRAPQVGRICMDFSMLNITGLEKISPGDVVTIFGADGNKTLPVAEQAAKAGTIPYELLCAVSPRVPRLYSHGPLD